MLQFTVTWASCLADRTSTQCSAVTWRVKLSSFVSMLQSGGRVADDCVVYHARLWSTYLTICTRVLGGRAVVLLTPFFTKRVVNICNCLRSDTVDFSSLTAWSIQLNVSISVISSTLHSSLVYLYCELHVCFSYVCILFYFISRVTVSAVFQPCRTCHYAVMFFMYVVYCIHVFLANKW